MISQQFRPELVFVFLLFSYGRLCAFYLFYTAHSHVTIEKYAFRAKAKWVDVYDEMKMKVKGMSAAWLIANCRVITLTIDLLLIVYIALFTVELFVK